MMIIIDSMLSILKIVLFYFLLGLGVLYSQKGCYQDEYVTSTFASGGSSPYRDQVLWLTWGAQSDSDVYGKTNQLLSNGSSSYASFDLGDGKLFCMQATIKDASGKSMRSYIPGNWSGDVMDDQFNIGGEGMDNQLVTGISVNSGTARFSIECEAFLEGRSVKLAGVVLADAESLDARGEYIKASAEGEWTITSMVKNIGKGSYLVKKSTIDGADQIEFSRGNNNKTGAITFLTFKESAFDEDYKVSFDVEFRGSGTTAIAIGLLVPNVDAGDAPISYGAPLHTLNTLNLSDDNVLNDIVTDINTSRYTPGKIISGNSDFLGTVGPDVDNSQGFSIDALGDDSIGFANEENAWPSDKLTVSYMSDYKPGNTFSVLVTYRGESDAYLAGWIDFNLNGIFDDEERAFVVAPADKKAVELSWIVPPQRVPNSTYARLRYSRDRQAVQSPVITAEGGEVEDYKIIVRGPMITNPIIRTILNKRSSKY